MIKFNYDQQINLTFPFVSVEVEKPFPIETIKKYEIPVPRPYPVHTIFYKHISEDDPVPQSTPMKIKPNYNAVKPKKFFLAKLNSRRDRH